MKSKYKTEMKNNKNNNNNSFNFSDQGRKQSYGQNINSPTETFISKFDMWHFYTAVSIYAARGECSRHPICLQLIFNKDKLEGLAKEHKDKWELLVVYRNTIVW
jgi:hypothetical protein